MAQASNPTVAVVIVHHSGFDHLYNTLKSVFESDYDQLQVTLVDNGSTDGSVQQAEKRFGHRFKVMRARENIGFVGGCNIALRNISTEYAVLLNDDTVVDRRWLTELVQEAEADPSIAACQPKLRMLSNPGFFEYNGACGGMLDLCGVPFTRGRLFDLAEEDFGQYDRTADIFWASGAAMFLRLKAVVEAGYLDELFYFHMEEIDLSWRLRLRGYRIVAVPSSIVYHLGGGTPAPTSSFFKHRNNLLTLIKNYSLPSLAQILPVRTLLDVASIFYLAVRGKAGSGLDTLRAYSWILTNLRQVLAARNASQSRRIVSDKTIRSSMAKPNISFQFFILKRRVFSDLTGLPLPLRSYLAQERIPTRKGRVLRVGSVF